MLPFKKLILTLGIEQIISSCEQLTVQIIFWFSVILNQRRSSFHFFKVFSDRSDILLFFELNNYKMIIENK